MNRDGSVVLGSARGSRAGCGGSPKRTPETTRTNSNRTNKVREGGPPSPAREPRALPGLLRNR
jgi:hypothetical protein